MIVKDGFHRTEKTPEALRTLNPDSDNANWQAAIPFRFRLYDLKPFCFCCFQLHQIPGTFPRFIHPDDAYTMIPSYPALSTPDMESSSSELSVIGPR